MQDARVLILTGAYKGEEGLCLGKADRPGLWAISPDESDEILALAFEKDFGLLVDLSADPAAELGVFARAVACRRRASVRANDAGNPRRLGLSGRGRAGHKCGALWTPHEIDKIVTKFRKTNPDFCNGYFAVRVIVNRAATHAAPSRRYTPTRIAPQR